MAQHLHLERRREVEASELLARPFKRRLERIDSNRPQLVRRLRAELLPNLLVDRRAQRALNSSTQEGITPHLEQRLARRLDVPGNLRRKRLNPLKAMLTPEPRTQLHTQTLAV